MTKEEKADLERTKANAKRRCGETYKTILQIQGILATYHKDYYRWRDRFKDADRVLAMEEKLKVVSVGVKKKKVPELSVQLTKEQIIALAEELGFSDELNFD